MSQFSEMSSYKTFPAESLLWIKDSPGWGRETEQTTAVEYVAGSFSVTCGAERGSTYPLVHVNVGSIKGINV